MYLPEENKILIGKSGDQNICMIPKMCNRHGLIAGATGTGKTVTLKVMAESFSEMGVPVFLADLKGDLSGMFKPGEPNDNVTSRVEKMNLENFTFTSFPTRFFDVFEAKGHPVRATVADLGPSLLARLLELNETQTGILEIVFRVADDNGYPILDMKDLKAMVTFVGEHASEYKLTYGNISTASVGAIQRALLRLEDAGADFFFGEPALDVRDWIATDPQSKGIINILNCVELYQRPLLYSTFMLWMLSEIYEIMPEAGDLDKPRLVFFFDEAHLMFDDIPKALLQKIEQIIKLIRSKAVGVYFITQVPSDIPDSVLSQLGNKVQHALRAYTPKDQKAVRAAAQAFRENPAFKTETVLQELGTGEALISVLDEQGIPTVVERAKILPPRSYMGIASDEEIRMQIQNSPLFMKYNEAIDRESAFEMLNEKAMRDAEEAELERQKQELEKEKAAQEKAEAKEREAAEKAAAKAKSKPSALEKAATNAGASVGRSVARQAGKSVGKQLDKKLGGGSFFSTMFGSAASSAGGSLVRGLMGNLKK